MSCCSVSVSLLLFTRFVTHVHAQYFFTQQVYKRLLSFILGNILSLWAVKSWFRKFQNYHHFQYCNHLLISTAGKKKTKSRPMGHIAHLDNIQNTNNRIKWIIVQTCYFCIPTYFHITSNFTHILSCFTIQFKPAKELTVFF